MEVERRKRETVVRSKVSSPSGVTWEANRPSCERRRMRLRRWRDLSGGTEMEAQRSDTVAGVPWRWMASGMASSMAHLRHIDLIKLKVDGVWDGEFDGAFKAH
ncbi:hypothetical protein HPP92_023582 [Vanilla planifolia]|uniref:Uncharacterized protein n=1 Tax=Vanilla planifolia TaxID=51239 RepID=A0A835PM16_VANPL|nr:hypothetical protein HPP92_023582 [Vanilla planifolia]